MGANRSAAVAANCPQLGFHSSGIQVGLDGHLSNLLIRPPAHSDADDMTVCVPRGRWQLRFVFKAWAAAFRPAVLAHGHSFPLGFSANEMASGLFKNAQNGFALRAGVFDLGYKRGDCEHREINIVVVNKKLPDRDGANTGLVAP